MVYFVGANLPKALGKTVSALSFIARFRLLLQAGIGEKPQRPRRSRQKGPYSIMMPPDQCDEHNLTVSS